ncbi:LOW QUALITY PROTEIN: coiled-coil domain-containing protein 60-like [Etheostoma cragini]|uniref:LOW QUALITY PROTEIN: coiled-coil domain-containing protein 60-like n=1 Tax=Etheostoma cragini TaxID=417921 RepID=UPI00155F2BCA|nr:LOW QUALITY PROTEIN: coiled-coil domain-containing protein 60-like [Etheostoma cragini]
MINRNSTLDPLRLGTVKPDLVCDQKRRARANTGPVRKESDSRENQDRRKLQLSRWHAPWRSSEVPSHLDTKPVILGNVGQHVETATTDDPPKKVDQSISHTPPDSTGGCKSWPVCRTQAGKRADIVSLRKHLGHARLLSSAIKRGQSYFHLLQKEEQEEQEKVERQRMSREQQRKTEPQPPSFSSDSDSDSEGWALPAGSSWSGVNEARKKSQSARPFTPVYHSLTSPLLSQAPTKLIYRQLCCLNWLLEALTLDRSGRVGPLTACWDPKDPGRGRTTMKTLKKERAIENKWEQFVSTKPRRAHPRRPRSSSARLHTHRKSPFMSGASLSALTPTPVGSSVSSLVPGAEEDTESPGAPRETDRPPSECLRTLSEDQKVNKDSQSSQTSSCPAKPPLAISYLINNKASMLRELKSAFDQRITEMSQSYVDILELKARERLNSGLQRYRALCHVTEYLGLPHHVTCVSQEKEAPNKNNTNKHSNNMWLSTLLSSLPEEVCREHAVSRVLEKLSGFADQQTLKVRPQILLKVLGGLEPWELCLPELCVAIQIATEHVVQMPREEYNAWLCSRVTLPPQCHRAPQTPGEHTLLRPGRRLQAWTNI